MCIRDSVNYSGGFAAAATAVAVINDEAVHETLLELRRLGLTVIPSGDALQLVPDAHIWTNGALYFVRSLARRNWTIRQALRDAEHIVRAVQSRQAVSYT